MSQAPKVLTLARAAGEQAAFVGRLLHPVDDAAAAAAAEDQRVGALQDLDPLDVVEAAVVLHVVAHAIEEEVGGGVLAAQGDLVAIALALADGDAGDVAQHVGDRVAGLVFQLLVRDHLDRLRHVDQRRVGLGRGDRLAGVIALGMADHEDFLVSPPLRPAPKAYGQGACGRQQDARRTMNGTARSLPYCE